LLEIYTTSGIGTELVADSVAPTARHQSATVPVA